MLGWEKNNARFATDQSGTQDVHLFYKQQESEIFMADVVWI